MNDRLRVLQRQPRRISITLSYHVHQALLSRSEEEGRSVSNLCAFLLEDALRDASRGVQANGAHPQAMRTLGNGLGHGISTAHGDGMARVRQSSHHQTH